jgi:hypothetical protein
MAMGFVYFSARHYRRFLFCCVLTFMSNAVLVFSQTQTERDFFNTTPNGNELYFIGVSPLVMNRDKAIKNALEDAARRVALYYRVSARYTSSLKTGSGIFDYESLSEFTLQQSDWEPYSEQLRFDREKDVKIIHNAVWVRTVFSDASPPRIAYAFSDSAREPEWITKTPVIAGYTVGIGMASRKLQTANTVIGSYKAAIASILQTSFSHVSAEISRGESTAFLGSTVSTRKQTVEAEGTIEGFYILDTWVDPANVSVWTLAVAKK